MGPVESPELVKPHQSARTVARTSAHACTRWNALCNVDAASDCCAADLLKTAGGSYAQVFIHVADNVARAGNFSAWIKLQDDVVAQINQNENGLEQVHTVGSASNHMQKKIEFGRGLEFNRCSRHGYSMASVKVICLGAVCESSTSAGELSVLRRLTAICQPA